MISRSEQERVLIEASINSVRVNVQIKQTDEMEKLLSRKFMSFLMQRAEPFLILRRKPLPVRHPSLPIIIASPKCTHLALSRGMT